MNRYEMIKNMSDISVDSLLCELHSWCQTCRKYRMDCSEYSWLDWFDDECRGSFRGSESPMEMAQYLCEMHDDCKHCLFYKGCTKRGEGYCTYLTGEWELGILGMNECEANELIEGVEYD